MQGCWRTGWLSLVKAVGKVECVIKSCRDHGTIPNQRYKNSSQLQATLAPGRSAVFFWPSRTHANYRPPHTSAHNFLKKSVQIIEIMVIIRTPFIYNSCNVTWQCSLSRGRVYILSSWIRAGGRASFPWDGYPTAVSAVTYCILNFCCSRCEHKVVFSSSYLH